MSEGRRKEFGQFGWKPEDVPDPGSPETFERSKLRWDELDEEPHKGLLEWHRALISLRRELPQLTDGRLDLICTDSSEEGQWLFVERGLVSIVANLADQPGKIPLREGRPTHILLASSGEGIEVGEDWVILPANSVAILGPYGQDSAQGLFRSQVEVLSI